MFVPNRELYSKQEKENYCELTEDLFLRLSVTRALRDWDNNYVTES